MRQFKRGDPVCYSAAFLRSTGLSEAQEAHMRGTVHQVALGAHEEWVAVVQFGRSYEDVRTVQIRNLSPINPNQWISQ